MGCLGKFALAGVVALIVPAGSVLAADMPGYYYETPTPYEVGSNWYLRGDLGYKWYSAPNASFDIPGYGKMKDVSLANTGVVGAGFGYKFNNSFRADVTVDYEWDAAFKGKLKCPDPCTGQPGTEYSKEYADISAWTGLANFYWDFDLSGEGLAGFTPYVGAGLGISNLTTTNVDYTNPNGSTGSWKGATTVNFAWALMAGVSVPVNDNWLFDINYRYLDLGNARSGKTLPQFNNKRIKYDDITASEVRAGFRYMLN